MGGMIATASAPAGRPPTYRRRYAEPAAGVTRTTTRAGRTGGASDRKSRTAAEWPQKPQPSWSAGESPAGGGAIGASHSGQASVPTARTDDRETLNLWVAAPGPPTGSGRTDSGPSIPR
jgi:hypothetical protein